MSRFGATATHAGKGPLLLCLVAVILIARQLLVAFPLGHDALEYPVRQVEFHENTRHGVLWPAWAPDLSNGHGQPLFVFSPPLFYWLAEPFVACGVPLYAALPLTLFLVLLASAGSAFLLGSALWGRWGGALTAVAYVTAPYVILNLYVRCAWAESAAFPFYPLALLGLWRLRTGGARHAGVAAIGLGLVGACHHPALLVFAPVFLACVVGLAWRGRDARLLTLGGLAFCLGLLLAAPFWLPALVEMKFTQVDRLLEGALEYRNHFVYVHQLIWSPWGYGLSLPGADDGMSFRLGLIHLAAAIAGYAWIRRAGAEPADLRHGLALIVVFSALMTTPLARPLWDHIGLLQFLQFPWRILGVTVVFLALLVGALGTPRSGSDARGARLRACLAASALLAGALPLATMPPERSSTPFDDEYYAPARVAALGMTTATREEFTPKTCEQTPAYSPSPAGWTEGVSGTVMVVERTPNRLRLRAASEPGGVLRLNLLHFPGWVATVDGETIAMQVEPHGGRIELRVPPGAHTVEARFEETASRFSGKLAGVLGLLGVLVLLTRGGPGKSATAE